MGMLPVTMADVRVGEALKWPIFDRHKRLLYRKGAVIRSEKQLDMLLKFGLQRNDSDDENAQNAREHAVANPFDRISDIISRLPRIVRPLFNTNPDAAAKAEITEFSSRIDKISDELIAICQFDADAALGDIHLDHQAPFSQAHPVHTAILALLIALHMDLPMERIKSLLNAALTANITITPLMETMHKQAGQMSDGQQSVFLKHPQGAFDLLSASGVKDKLWLDIVLQHHERFDGEGFPRKLRESDILDEAKILRLADEYYNVIFECGERPAPSPHDVLKALYLKYKDTPEASIVQGAIKEFGVYPPGTIVTLTNEEVAVVVWRALDNTKPTVKTIINEHGTAMMKPRERNTRSSGSAIKDIYHARMMLHLNMLALWGYER